MLHVLIQFQKYGKRIILPLNLEIFAPCLLLYALYDYLQLHFQVEAHSFGFIF